MQPVLVPKTATTAAYTGTPGVLALDGTKSPGQAVYELVTTTLAWLAQGIAASTFTANATTDQLTLVSPTTHGQVTGDGPVQLTTTTTLPAGLSTATNYWLIVVSPGVVKLATSRANAIAGTAVDFTDAGSGTHTMTTVATSSGAGSTQVPAGLPRLLDGCNGPAISIVQDAAGGKATLTAVSENR
jgi:plastocyanin